MEREALKKMEVASEKVMKEYYQVQIELIKNRKLGISIEQTLK